MSDTATVEHYYDDDGVEWVDCDGYALPVLNWCRECWAEAAPMEEPLPDECEVCGSTDVTRL